MKDSVITGVWGTAKPVTIPDRPDASETVALWLLTVPARHPLWSQYALLVVKLTDGKPGFPDPYHAFPGSTHELLVLAVDPTDGPTTVAAANSRAADGEQPIPFLMGPNVVHQVIATDAEMREFAELAAHAVIDGILDPESGDAPQRVRAAWRSSIDKTLAHIRGAHA